MSTADKVTQVEDVSDDVISDNGDIIGDENVNENHNHIM